MRDSLTPKTKAFFCHACLALACLMFTSCAGSSVAGDRKQNMTGQTNMQVQKQVSTDKSDPLEPMNRAFFAFNDFLDQLLIRPLSIIYKGLTPNFVQSAITNAFANLSSLTVIPNDLLQGRFRDGGLMFARTMFNTMFGLGGTIDIATKWGIKTHDNDFGATLGRWGVPTGPYIVLPVFGSMYLRGSANLVFNPIFSPFTYTISGSDIIPFYASYNGLNIVSLRAKNGELIDMLSETSVDYYTTMKMFYSKRRDNTLAGTTSYDPEGTQDPRKTAHGAVPLGSEADKLQLPNLGDIKF